MEPSSPPTDRKRPRAKRARPDDPVEDRPVWSYRGYNLRSSEFTTAMAHLFRGEIQRANVWRQRLDTTTNWAVISAGAAVTIAFTESGHHGVILLNALLITVFLWIEARRCRYYELWSSRVRLLETDFYAAMLVPPFQPAPDWAESLAENLLHPQFPISMWEAFGRRYRRNYMWVYAVMIVAWLAKTLLLPTVVSSWSDAVLRAAIGDVPGGVVLAAGALFNSALFIIGMATIGLQQASGEVLPRFGLESESGANEGGTTKAAGNGPAWYLHRRRRAQFLSLIVTELPQKISERVLQEMQRGVTALSGVGMYTGSARSVLMCALTVTEVNHLKNIVEEIDPNAFVIISPASEILGRGFLPLQEKTWRDT